MNIRKKFSRGLAVLAIGACAPAWAIPLAFDFSGTVQSRTTYDAVTGSNGVNTAWDGLAFTARMVFETDGFQPGVLNDGNGWRSLWSPLDGNLPGAMSASLNIGGNEIDVLPFNYNQGYLELSDTEGYQSCGANCGFGVPDSLLLVARSNLMGPLGNLQASLFQLNAYQAFVFPDPNSVEYDYVDLDNPFAASDLLTIALPNLSFSYATSSFDCQALNLCYLQTSETTRFNVTSLTRSNLSATSVPEPGTLGLLAAGLFAAGFGRRKLRRA
jgi:PEP-CTERM motif